MPSPGSKQEGLTILLVEQMAWMALETCDRAYVLESGPARGRAAGQGTPRRCPSARGLPRPPPRRARNQPTPDINRTPGGHIMAEVIRTVLGDINPPELGFTSPPMST